MSVVAIPTRRHPGVRPARPRTSPTLTITLDLVPGPLSPRLARLVQLLGELAESGEGHLRAVEEAASGEGHLRALEATASGPRPATAEPSVAADHVRILAGSRMVRRGDRVIALTRIEYELLLFLAERPRRVFTRRQLLASVWGYEHAVARTVDVHVRRLRAKLAGSEIVTTVYGVGYRLADEAPISVDHRS